MKAKLGKFSCVILSVVLSLSMFASCTKKEETQQTKRWTQPVTPISSLTEEEAVIYNALLGKIDTFKDPKSVRLLSIEHDVGQNSADTPLNRWQIMGTCVYLEISANNSFGSAVTELYKLDFSEWKNGYLSKCETQPSGTLMTVKSAESRVKSINNALKYHWEQMGV